MVGSAFPLLPLALGGLAFNVERRHLRKTTCEAKPVVVLGGGVMGRSTAWSLCRSGNHVVLLDGGHAEKGSWGESRIARLSYADPVMVRLARRSYELYGTLSQKASQPIMYKTGCLDVSCRKDLLDNLAKTYEDLGQPYERLNHKQVEQRWPVLQLTTDYVQASVYCPEGDAVALGVVMETLKDQIHTLAGPAAYIDESVVSIDRQKKTVTTEDGTVISYSKLVLAAGIWTNGLLQKMNLSLLPLVATIEQNTYYAPSKGREPLYGISAMPVVKEHMPPPNGMKKFGGYMIPHMPNGVEGVKFGMHRQGPVLEHEDFPVLPGSAAAVERHFRSAQTRGRDLWCRRWPEDEDSYLRSETDAYCKRILPSLQVHRSELTMRCPYDQHLYADEDFVVGFHPDDPDVVVVAGFAGEGFKFAPAIGEMASSLITGQTFAVPELIHRFRLNRPNYLK
ncbi:unnamed protein product [Durusdinium trenchii]|uniref:N-methyl-L-tryptophan oxidase (MTOX) n=3 Tax=Durusdinium trenchii TaxID=1381693 RepID=A0ABP0LGE8_9DINO